jgi:hypothetical protein
MERAGTLLRIDTSAASTQLDRPRRNSDLAQVPALMAQMKANYPGQELLPETADMWMAAWLEMVLDYGLEPFRAALIPLLRSSRFFPHPAEIEEAIEAKRAEERAERDLQRSQDQRREHMAEFWAWVDERLGPGGFNEGMGEQEFLNRITTPGYTGMKARVKA